MLKIKKKSAFSWTKFILCVILTCFSHLAVCHGWQSPPLVGWHDYGDGGFCCASGVCRHHLKSNESRSRSRVLHNLKEPSCYHQSTLNYAGVPLTQSILTSSCLAIRLIGGINHTGLLVVAATAGTATAVIAAHALAGIGVSTQITFTLQQGVGVTVRVLEHWWNKESMLHTHTHTSPNFAVVKTQLLLKPPIQQSSAIIQAGELGTWADCVRAAGSWASTASACAGSSATTSSPGAPLITSHSPGPRIPLSQILRLGRIGQLRVCSYQSSKCQKSSGLLGQTLTLTMLSGIYLGKGSTQWLTKGHAAPGQD